MKKDLVGKASVDYFLNFIDFSLEEFQNHIQQVLCNIKDFQSVKTHNKNIDDEIFI